MRRKHEVLWLALAVALASTAGYALVSIASDNFQTDNATVTGTGEYATSANFSATVQTNGTTSQIQLSTITSVDDWKKVGEH